jgi:hypothetical protein
MLNFGVTPNSQGLTSLKIKQYPESLIIKGARKTDYADLRIQMSEMRPPSGSDAEDE